jgi:hypothetical protein
VATWETVCALLAELPETERTPPDRYHSEGVRVRGKMVSYLAGSEPADSGSVDFAVIRIGYPERAALVQEDPGTFIVTPHYQNYPGVIVRLATVDDEQLRELLMEAWRLVAPRRLVREYDAG